MERINNLQDAKTAFVRNPYQSLLCVLPNGSAKIVRSYEAAVSFYDGSKMTLSQFIIHNANNNLQIPESKQKELNTICAIGISENTLNSTIAVQICNLLELRYPENMGILIELIENWKSVQ